MTHDQRIAKAEELVSNVLVKFDQKITSPELRKVAEKIAKAVKVKPTRGS
jgi:hypothetical protein